MDPSHATSTLYARPYRPRAVAFVNGAGRLFERARLGRVDLGEERLLRTAQRRAGLEDFGEPSFREPLARLLAAIEREARLTPVGRLLIRERLSGLLQNRLRAVSLFARRPEVLDLELAPPIVIAGLPRTGTTLLHRLLAADPSLRALRSWEALNPAPFPGRHLAQGRRDPRIRMAERSVRGITYLAPDFLAVHPVDAHAPEEELLLLDVSFRSTVAEALLRVPSFARWLEEQDQTPAYVWARDLLKLLAWQGGGRCWVLKTPHHLEWLDTLLAVFPGATIVQTHRDPARILPSLCSLFAHARGVFSDEVDPIEIGRDCTRKVRRMIDRAMDSRDRHREARFADVAYEALVRDPIGEVERLYARVGLVLSAEARRAMEGTLRDHGRERHGKHVYRAADFGLDERRISETFADYRKRFEVGSG
ncbi:MAG TPA: sulfotransferase [bacterium]|nr:sulfotransferase [bacterium]